MAKKPQRFVENFIGEYIGETPEEFAANLPRLMDKALEFCKACDGDLDFAKALNRAQDSQETRRILIRTIPPYVEGKLNFLRIVPFLFPPLLERIPEGFSIIFAEPMLAFKNRTSSKEAIKKTLIGIGHVADIPMASDLMGESGAQELMATFGLRDGLMHPCSIEAFTISDDQMASAYRGVYWFDQKFACVFSPLKKVVKDIFSDENA